MAGFKVLKDISSNFDEELKRMNDELFSAKPQQSVEEAHAKTVDNLKLFSAKYKLLKAKTKTENPSLAERILNGANLIEDYDATAEQCVIERAVVKSITQSRGLQDLLSTPDNKLDPEIAQRKRKIQSKLAEFRLHESLYLELSAALEESEREHAQARAEWDAVSAEMQETEAEAPESDEDNPLLKKLQTMSETMEKIRWLIGKFVSARSTKYDWLADPRRCAGALAASRLRCDVAAFTERDPEDDET